LSTKFERECKRHSLEPYYFKTIEKNIIRGFKRRALQYITTLPEEDEIVDWLSLIQHYGGPTRLLDFSYSFYVSIFFATKDTRADSAVWCVNINYLINNSEHFKDHLINVGYHDTVHKCVKYANLILNTDQFNEGKELYIKPSVCIVEPYVQEQRLGIQQGFFLFPTNIGRTFEANVMNFLNIDDNSVTEKSLREINTQELHDIPGEDMFMIKLTLSKDLIYEATDQLQSMNITDSTLFPGIDGFTRSLSNHIHSMKRSTS
jgi:hypothetical protein